MSGKQLKPWTRRLFIALVLLLVPSPGRIAAQTTSEEASLSKSTFHVPARAITSGPEYHWFGYYDKLQFDPTDRYVLGMRVGFEGRSPRPEDTIEVGMVDLQDKNRWIRLGQTRAWNWQQGCMLQWMPGSDRKVLWNDREGDQFVCRILDVATRKMRTLPHPVYALSPDGRTAVAPDFRRINDMRPGYGYAGPPDPFEKILSPAQSGIYSVDLESGERRLIVSIADAARISYPHEDLSDAKHYFNHLLFNTDGSRFIFLHRWRKPNGRTFGTRMMTASPDGSEVRVIDDYGHTSHFIWRDPSNILAWAYHPSYRDRFYLYRDTKPIQVEVLGHRVMTQNGHCTYLPGNEWILNDTYPDENRKQHVYLYHVPTGRKVPLASLHTPPEYQGEWRVDTHPRFSRDGKLVCLDSPAGLAGRQLWLLDISGIVDEKPPAIDQRFQLSGEEESVFIWGRGESARPVHFQEFLPALFDRTLVLDECSLIGDESLEWIFTGDRAGFTVTLTDDSLALRQRWYDSFGLHSNIHPSSREERHPERIWQSESVTISGPPRTLQVTIDGNMQLTVSTNGEELIHQSCLFDVHRHQLQLRGGRGPVRGVMRKPAPQKTLVRVRSDRRRQTMIGWGGIAAPLAYQQLSERGKQQWWELVSEYNLLIQREYPIGTMLKADLSNWDSLEDSVPHYYGSNFPNSEISDFEYLRKIRALGGIVWFEFWRLPAWMHSPAGEGKSNLQIEKYAGAVVAYCKELERQTGRPPDVVGVQNELTQPAEVWYSMALGLRQALDSSGFPDVKIHMADAGSLSKGIEFAKAFLGSSEVWKVIDYAASHMYDYQGHFEDPDKFDPVLYQWADLTGEKPFLSTELCINYPNWQVGSYRVALAMGQLYHKNLTIANASAICYCWTLLNVVEPSYGKTRSLFVPDKVGGFMPVASSNQLRVFGAYSRRIKEGMVRVETEVFENDLLATAFTSDSGGGETLVLLNRSTRPFWVTIEGVQGLLKWKETADLYHQNSAEEWDGSGEDILLEPGALVTLSNVPLGSLSATVKNSR